MLMTLCKKLSYAHFENTSNHFGFDSPVRVQKGASFGDLASQSLYFVSRENIPPRARYSVLVRIGAKRRPTCEGFVSLSAELNRLPLDCIFSAERAAPVYVASYLTERLVAVHEAKEGSEMYKSEVAELRNLLETKRNNLLLTCSHREDIVIEATADEIDRLQQLDNNTNRAACRE
jgi:hypothetical protein